MAKHEFGIMEQEPAANEIFITYEPQKYNCLTVDDDFIEPIIVNLQEIVCYWHTLERPKKGLAYYGITLMPPTSIEAFINVLSSQNKHEYTSLIEMAMQAKENSQYMIHFGI